jgi:hypothetical protein
VLVPAAYAREHQNQWIDSADSFVSAEDVDRAMMSSWREQHDGIDGVEYEAAVDLGVVHDPTVIAVAHRDDDGRVVLDCMQTFQGSKRRPVELSAVESALLDLSQRFRLTRIQVESWQGMELAQRLEAQGLPVEIFGR